MNQGRDEEDRIIIQINRCDRKHAEGGGDIQKQTYKIDPITSDNNYLEYPEYYSYSTGRKAAVGLPLFYTRLYHNVLCTFELAANYRKSIILICKESDQFACNGEISLDPALVI